MRLPGAHHGCDRRMQVPEEPAVRVGCERVHSESGESTKIGGRVEGPATQTMYPGLVGACRRHGASRSGVWAADVELAGRQRLPGGKITGHLPLTRQLGFPLAEGTRAAPCS
ncbi:hypothetical protein ACFPRL_25565 [Pseudoclavibacter helvolus]